MQQHRAMTMTAQGRDSLIARLLDSAGRAQDPTIAQRLRDSVTVLRSAAVSGDNMSNRMTTMQQQQRDSMQQRQGSMQQLQRDSMQQRQADRTQQRQPSSVTSDQRVRMQKDGRP